MLARGLLGVLRPLSVMGIVKLEANRGATNGLSWEEEDDLSEVVDR